MKRLIPIVGFIFLGLLTVFVFTQVMAIRFATGELYPHYSTQRTDPLGAQALYDSYAGLDSMSVSRNFTPLARIPSLDENSALFLVGVPRQNVNDLRAKDDSAIIKAVTENGARLILTINPRSVAEAFQPQKTKEEKERARKRSKEIRKRLAKKEDTKESDDAEKDDEDDWKKLIGFDDEEFEEETRKFFGTPILDRWELEFSDSKIDERPEEGWKVTAPKGNQKAGRPTVFPNWKSQHRFKTTASGPWKTIARVGGKPVVVERKLGKGTIVVASDSFFASNEALHLGASPEFLMWLTGGKSHLVFDETIHGSSVSVGSMTLIKQYRLHGFFIGMFVFVALWAWRTSSSLAPGSEEIERGLIGDDGTVSGEDSGSGFVRLLQRSVPVKELLGKCATIWRESSKSKLTPSQEKYFENILASHTADPKSNDPVSTYQRLANLLKRRI